MIDEAQIDEIQKETTPSPIEPLKVNSSEIKPKIPFEPVKTFLDLKVLNLVVGNHKNATTPQVVNVIYGTGATPAASTTPEGTIYLTYTA
jgi:hypothetical protein